MFVFWVANKLNFIFLKNKLGHNCHHMASFDEVFPAIVGKLHRLKTVKMWYKSQQLMITSLASFACWLRWRCRAFFRSKSQLETSNSYIIYTDPEEFQSKKTLEGKNEH